MPNIANILKNEIQRIARKEIKTSASELHKYNVYLKKNLAELRRQIAAMKQEVRQLKKLQCKQQKAEPGVTEAADKLRFSAKGIRSWRRKLKLSQADFAKLMGVSGLAVYQWERKEGNENEVGGDPKLGQKRSFGTAGTNSGQKIINEDEKENSKVKITSSPW